MEDEYLFRAIRSSSNEADAVCPLLREIIRPAAPR